MYGRGSRGGRGGRGGLYSGFVASSSSQSGPYRGAEIPPPASLGMSFRSNQSQVPPPPSYSEKESRFNNPTPGMGYSQYGVNVKKQKTEEEYFNEDEDDDESKAKKEKRKADDDDSDSDSDEDPLDAFMANLEKDAKERGLKDNKGKDAKKKQAELKGVRDDIEEVDNEESYYKWLEENPNAGRAEGDEDELGIEYDEDGNPIAPVKSKYIDPLPPIDHTAIDYKPFEKNFYNEHADISGLTGIQVIDLQQKLNLRVAGAVPPKPVTSFAHFGFDETLMKVIRKSEYTQPTPIQAQGIPALLSGRDVIGIAKTGSGKTFAFLGPLLVHIMDQPRLLRGDGPIGLILAPTRELAMQIYSEAKRFGRVYDIQAVCAYGGGSKWEQSKAFEAGAEIAIATPGRLIDMIKMKVTNLERVTYLVLDEADRMFDLGFEPQVRSICDHVRPNRQTMLFSATFKKKIEKLARDTLCDPVKIVQGSIGEASDDVAQIVKVMGVGGFKWQWLIEHLVEFTSAGSVLIFVTKKQNSEELTHNLRAKEFDCRCIHGDLNQHERNEILHSFKKREFPILIATDVAARGLDIPHIRTVVNFDLARDIDTHTHRIGRTGRAGVKGTAYTLVTEKDKEFAGHIVRNLEAANQDVTHELMDLAMQSSWFRSSRFKRGRGKGCPKERPGFGAAPSSANSSGLSDSAEQYIFGDSTGPVVPSGGGGSSRLSAVKQAFKSSYMAKFQKASGSSQDTSTVGSAGVVASVNESLMPPPPPGMGPPEPLKDPAAKPRKRKSRWE